MKGTPGCFGAATVFRASSEVCTKCGYSTECREESEKTMTAIRELVDSESFMRKIDRAEKQAEKSAVESVVKSATADIEISQEDMQIIEHLSLKSSIKAKKLCSSGLMQKIREELREGRNALAATNSPKFVCAALDLLLHGGFTRSELKSRYMSEFGWGDGTAASHVSMVAPILLGFGLAQENSGRIVLGPTSGL